MADSTYTSGAINFAGLGNGTDFNALIDNLIAVETNRVTRLETWKASWETKNAQFKALNTQMLSMKTTLEGFETMNKFMSKTVTSTDPTLLTATADGETQTGSHSIEVGQLASQDVQITTSGANSLDASITDTETFFTFSYGGVTHTLSNISPGTTLQRFVDIINNHADSRNFIRASTIFDGSLYHLQISGLDTGSDNQLVISNAGNVIFRGADFNETQNAENSQIRVNGFPPSGQGWIENSSNTIKDVIEGITLNLNDAQVGAEAKLNIVTDTEDIKNHVIAFVDAVNTVRAQIISITSVNDDGEGSILTGNYGVDIISQKLKDITASMGLGFSVFDPTDNSGDVYSALAQIGITTDAEEGSETYGLLKINGDMVKGIPGLNDALRDNPAAVAELFAANFIGKSHSSDFTYTSLVEGTTEAGIYDIQIVSDGTTITSATINGEPAKVSGWGITGISGSALGLGIRLDNTTAGTYSGQVSIKTGKAGEMINALAELTKPYNEYTYEGGPLAVLQDNYRDIMDGIDDKIAFEKTRIEKMETNLRLKFARLDALLGQYELRQGQLDAATAQLE